jgi:[acyl-carrier-protein] S-malonyltransferase
MVDAGIDTFVEIGSGSVLTGLIRRIAPAVRLVNVNDLGSALAFANQQ